MTILYIFPHPDDESFGPGAALAAQRRQGHQVHLLTLTKGGATRQRHKFGYSIEQMGEIRAREMQDVARVLDLSGMTILDFPDSGLKEVDPRELEDAVRAEILRVRPQVIATYPVHGISGFHDHLVAHAVVKRVFVELRGNPDAPRRLAFEALTEEDVARFSFFRLTGSKPEEIDCEMEVLPEDIDRAARALDCYVTYRDTVAGSNIKDFLVSPARFEIFQERHDPPLGGLFEQL
ncbi:MAG: PIG-L family deacetylase [Candidatus Zixiibacteriota bacterium]|nr:MAG: PIG-L family deacetylase [candidate division Zixibacteria bacterium]